MAASGMGTERQMNGSHVSLTCSHLSGRARSLSAACSVEVVKPSNREEMTLVLRHRCAQRWRRDSSSEAGEQEPFEAHALEVEVDCTGVKASESVAVVLVTGVE